jgi:hypothetical protein
MFQRSPAPSSGSVWWMTSLSNCYHPHVAVHHINSDDGDLWNIGFNNYCVTGHCPSSCFYLKHNILKTVSVFRWNLLSWAQSIELVSISGRLHQHKIGYTNQAQHKPSARFKRNIKNIKKLDTYEAYHQSTVRIDVITREINSVCGTNIKKSPLNLHWTEL